MLKIKHFVHPLRTARIARERLRVNLQRRHFASTSYNHFRADPRYDLQNVTKGFVPRFADSGSEDTQLLQRICTAYGKALADQRFAPRCYEPTEWWKEIQRCALGPVMHALRNSNIEALRGMYRNFFRDPCGGGLVGIPFGTLKAYFQASMKDVYRRTYLGDALYRIDYWTAQTGGRFNLSDLRSPAIGNPFGVLIDGTLVRSASEFQHYCAHQILKLRSGRGVVAEIGGGYGGLAYYLLRDSEAVTYVDFDVPESIALASYYLLKAFPSMRFVLYGEKALTPETLSTSDVVLMPLFELPKLPISSVQVTFSSHALSDLTPGALADYMKVTVHSTKNYFLYLGGDVVAGTISAVLREIHNAPVPSEMRPSNWNRHIAPDVREVECTYGLARV
ncbi:MAG TPA: putative sugar O-methyltransferase [Terriglobales bacterium]|nr:putative sugar O-methyltransferase [Terriglobales bacterium]